MDWRNRDEMHGARVPLAEEWPDMAKVLSVKKLVKVDPETTRALSYVTCDVIIF
jgi:hypothetical protein